LGFSWHPEANGPELEAKGECELYEHFADLYMKKYGKKFISSASVHRLAKKYGLILGEARNFVGFIPDFAIAEIEQLKVSDEDRDYAFHAWDIRLDARALNLSLMVVAPLKDFRTEGMKVVDNQLVPIDPIALTPVKGGYLIAAKWGAESEIPEMQ
jgi:hypothetical protein